MAKNLESELKRKIEAMVRMRQGIGKVTTKLTTQTPKTPKG